MMIPPGYAWLETVAFNSYSQDGEDGVLQAIFSLISPANKWCLECGAADGLFFSNTRRLIEEGWKAILIEADPAQHARLVENSEAEGVHCVNATINAACRLETILDRYAAPRDIDLLVLDIDGQEYYAFNALRKYQPRVVLIEFDHNVHEDFIPTLGGPGQAGQRAIARLGAGKFYTAVYRNFCNMILVRQPLDRLLVGSLKGMAP